MHPLRVVGLCALLVCGVSLPVHCFGAYYTDADGTLRPATRDLPQRPRVTRVLARLCRQAPRNPHLTAAAIMLRDDLDDPVADDGSVPRAAPPRDQNPGEGEIRVGMRAGEVRQLLGTPKRVARQVLFRRYIEQWTYERPRSLCVNFNCIKGQEPHVLGVHELGLPRP